MRPIRNKDRTKPTRLAEIKEIHIQGMSLYGSNILGISPPAPSPLFELKVEDNPRAPQFKLLLTSHDALVV